MKGLRRTTTFAALLLALSLVTAASSHARPSSCQLLCGNVPCSTACSLANGTWTTCALVYPGCNGGGQ